MEKLRVNIVSESEFTVQGHGVHTAYLEMRESLTTLPEIDLSVNAKPHSSAQITHLHTVGLFAFRHMISRRAGKKVVSAHIVPDSLLGSIIGARWWLPFFKPYLRWFYNHADLVIAVSPYTLEKLNQLKIKAPIVVLENSINTKKYSTTPAQKKSLREKLNLPADKFIVVGNGQIQPRKKFDTFVAMAKKLPEIQFVWVGGIPFRAAGADFVHLNKLMKKPPENLRITDVISLDKAGQYMRAADMMFMPSTQETFGLAIIEGAAAGLPVLVRDLRDYDETFGNLVLRGNDKTYAELILRLKKDRNFFSQWQGNSAQLAAKYDSATVTKKLVNLYKEVLKK